MSAEGTEGFVDTRPSSRVFSCELSTASVSYGLISLHLEIDSGADECCISNI